MNENRFENDLQKLDWENSYTNEDSEKIRQGFLATSMDDKWDLVFEENVLSIYRSWTGLGLYKLVFENQNGSLHVKEALVDSKFLKNFSNEYCVTLLNACIEWTIFRRQAESPLWDYSK